jgi:hypothetical protein
MTRQRQVSQDLGRCALNGALCRGKITTKVMAFPDFGDYFNSARDVHPVPFPLVV